MMSPIFSKFPTLGTSHFSCGSYLSHTYEDQHAQTVIVVGWVKDKGRTHQTIC